LDKLSDKEHWKKTIKKYNLIGTHIIANDTLKKDIISVTKMKGITWYLIKYKNNNLSGEFIYRPTE